MRERPILMSAPMVRAILAGTKTQTRRVWKMPRGCGWYSEMGGEQAGWFVDHGQPWWLHVNESRCPYGHPGDRLWVRENFQPLMADDVPESEWRSCDYKTGKGYKISYPATDSIVEFYDIGTDEAFCDRVRPSIHMPRWASRIVLEITDVRVERLQEISEADAMAEGIETTQRPYGIGYRDYRGAHGAWFTEARTSYQSLWESINADRVPWKSNPWVWVLQFRRV